MSSLDVLQETQMSFRPLLVASAMLAFAAPAAAWAQTAPAAPPPATVEQAPTPEQLAFQARADAFKARMEVMAGEMRTVLTASGGDQAAASAQLDAITARYQPEADAFGDEVVALINSEAAKTTNEAEKAEMLAAAPQVRTAIGSIPAQIRASMVAAASAPAAAPQ